MNDARMAFVRLSLFCVFGGVLGSCRTVFRVQLHFSCESLIKADSIFNGGLSKSHEDFQSHFSITFLIFIAKIYRECVCVALNKERTI